MNRIKQLRKEMNINQNVLADFLNLEVAGVSKLETERVPLKDEYILKLAKYFNVSTDYLLGNSNIKNIAEIDLLNMTGLDITGLDENDLKDLQCFIDYVKWKKKKQKN